MKPMSITDPLEALSKWLPDHATTIHANAHTWRMLKARTGHNAIDPETDVRPGDYFRDWLAQQLNRHHWTRQTLADWQPPVAARRGRRPQAAS